MLTKEQSQMINDISNHKGKYLKIAKQEINGNDLYTLECEYSKLLHRQLHFIADTGKSVTSNSRYLRELKKRKTDPFLAGGATQAIGGLGVGAYAAVSAAENNANIDENRAKYKMQALEDDRKADESEKELLEVATKIEKILSSIPGIIKFRKNEKERLYNEKEQLYNLAKEKMKDETNFEELAEAANIFSDLSRCGFKDSAVLADQALKMFKKAKR